MEKINLGMSSQSEIMKTLTDYFKENKSLEIVAEKKYEPFHISIKMQIQEIQEKVDENGVRWRRVNE